MNREDEFFFDLKEWSGRKLRIIQKYLSGFTNIFGSRSDEIYYIDGFAGRGIYDDGEKGSPVLAAEISEKLRNSKRPYSLYCINVEKNHDNFINLSNETNKYGSYVKNYEGTFEENIDEILSDTQYRPAVFFLDDFGVKGTDWDSVRKVARRKDSTDIWIRFDHKTVRRLSGFADSEAKDAQGKLITLQNLFGIEDLGYLNARLSEGVNAEGRIRMAVNLYIEQLEQAFSNHGKKGFAASYPIISIDDQQKYHLVFACAHLKAATLASNIVDGIEETFQHTKMEYTSDQDIQLSLFSTEYTEKQIFNDKVQKLMTLILNLQKKRSLSREELLYEVIVNNKEMFGKIGRKHLTEALKKLLTETNPKIACQGTPGKDNSIITIYE